VVSVNALQANTSGFENTAIGSNALLKNTTGSYNTAIGVQALGENTDGSYNTAVGVQALMFNYGSYNTGWGFVAGGTTVASYGSYNTFLGYAASAGVGVNPTNSTAIGNGATIDASNQIVLGNTSISSLKCKVELSVTSDARDKTNFEPLDAGLNFINVIKPVRFDWNQRGGGLEGRKDVGFTAQDLLEVQEKTAISIPNLVDVSDPDNYNIMNTQLLPILVKAVQELSAKVQELSAKVIILETELNELKNK
jgi:hypothetical protein